MDVNEIKIKDLTETVVESIVSLNLGKEPKLLLNSVSKSIATNKLYFILTVKSSEMPASV